MGYYMYFLQGYYFFENYKTFLHFLPEEKLTQTWVKKFAVLWKFLHGFWKIGVFRQTLNRFLPSVEITPRCVAGRVFWGSGEAAASKHPLSSRNARHFEWREAEWERRSPRQRQIYPATIWNAPKKMKNNWCACISLKFQILLQQNINL